MNIVNIYIYIYIYILTKNGQIQVWVFHQQYPYSKLKLVEKIEAVMKRMRWKAFYFEQSGTHNNNKNIYYGLTSDKTPPPMKLLELFEKDLFKIVKKLSFERSTVNSKINLTQK